MDPNESGTTSEFDRLAELEAAQAAEEKQQPKPDDATPDGDRAPSPDKTPESAPVSDPDKKTDTPSDAEKQEAAAVDAAKQEAEKEGKELALDDKGKPRRDAQGKFVKRDKPAPEITLTKEEHEKFEKYLLQQKGSKYGKDFDRRFHTWAELNKAKDTLATERASFEKAMKDGRARFDADVLAFQQQSRPTPERFEAWHKAETDKATELETKAKEAGKAGNFDEQERLQAEAAEARAMAKVAKARAEELRKNPPPTVQQEQAKFVADQKQWVSKAAIDFPEFAKKDSPVMKGAAEYYKQMTAQMPFLSKLPGFIYFCAERAQLKTAADRVPALEKELGELKPKLAELEALTNPAPGGGGNRIAASKDFEQMTPEQQYAWLKDHAQ
jgi:hypothetical protein